MATFDGSWFPQVFSAVFNKEIDFVGTPDTLKAALVTSAYDPAANEDTHNYFDDITNELAASGGYVSGGFTLDNVSWGYTAGTNTWKLDCDDEVVPSTTLTWRSAIIYVDTGGAASTDPLVIYQKGDSDTITTGGTLTLQPHANGLGTIVVS